MKNINKKNLWFIGISAIIVILLNIRLFAPLETIEISTAELYEQNSNQPIKLVGDMGISMVNDSGESFNIFSMVHELKTGAYTVDVYYDSNVDGTDNHTNKVAELSFVSYENPSAIAFDMIQLADGSQVYSTRIWNQALTTVEDLTMKMTYYGQGDLTLSKIVIEESFLYRIMRLLGTIIIVGAIASLAYFLVISSKTEKSIKNAKYTGVVLCSVIFASLPVFQNYLIHSGDLFYHLNRITSLATELGNGAFPVRIAVEDLNGYGYANSLFYCDIFLYLPAILFHCMLPLRTCYQLYIVIINIATILIAYYSLHIMINNQRLSMLGAVLYLLAPYRFTNLYNRSAVGEYTAMTFLPLIVASMYLIYTKEKIRYQDWVLLSIGMSGLIMSHILSTQMCVVFLALTCVILWKKTFQPKCFLALLKASGLTILLTAWYTIPFIQSMLTSIQVMGYDAGKIQSHGAYLMQLFLPFVSATGYSMSNTLTSDMPITLGISAIIGLVCVCYCCLYGEKIAGENKSKYQSMILMTGLAMLAIVFTLQAFPWDSLEGMVGTKVATLMAQIQFPWRYLTIATVLIVIGTILALYILKDINKKYYTYATFLVAIATVLYCSFFYYGFMEISYCFSNASEPDMDFSVTYMGFEYLLDGTESSLLNSSQVKASSDAVMLEDYIEDKGEKYLTVYSMSANTEYVTLPILNYDNYQVVNDWTGESLEIINGENNCISVEIDPYFEGVLKIEYVAPILWRVMEVVSLLTVLSVFAVPVYQKKKKG
ncbi:MAG: hypothetical protein R3Y24_09405 [Eubacteriales bacterium]